MQNARHMKCAWLTQTQLSDNEECTAGQSSGWLTWQMIVHICSKSAHVVNRLADTPVGASSLALCWAETEGMGWMLYTVPRNSNSNNSTSFL